jgi:hypothetical protein
MNLQDAWCRETSSDPDHWTPENPALGQCAVSALVIQDLLGGELLRGLFNGTSHYWNRLDNGQIIDVTKQQFSPLKTQEFTGARTRAYVLSFPDTVTRYKLLKSRIEEKKA